jgi:ribosome maturation factor RimP
LPELENKIKEIVIQNGCFFIDLKWKGNKNNPLIEVFIDTEKGVTVSECSKVSKEISKYLDLLPNLEKYRLDVSSPGIDTLLKENWQFNKNISRKVEVQFDQDGSVIKEKGILDKVLEESITLVDENKENIEIFRNKIILAKVII